MVFSVCFSFFLLTGRSFHRIIVAFAAGSQTAGVAQTKKQPAQTSSATSKPPSEKSATSSKPAGSPKTKRPLSEKSATSGSKEVEDVAKKRKLLVAEKPSTGRREQQRRSVDATRKKAATDSKSRKGNKDKSKHGRK